MRLALKNNDLSSKHPCHKGCCNRLYNISKSFLKVGITFVIDEFKCP